MGIVFFNQIEERKRKTKISILIGLKVSWKTASQNNDKDGDEVRERVNHNPGADMSVMGIFQILRTEKKIDLFLFLDGKIFWIYFFPSENRVICMMWHVGHMTFF